MISRLQGTLLTGEPGLIEVETGGGVVYEVAVPLTVFQRLPALGSPLEIRTLQVVTDSSIALYGFLAAHERTLFQRLLSASGVGAKVALAMMSTFSAERLARALVEKDTAALQQIPGIGRKKAEKVALELADRVADLAIVTPNAPGKTSAAQETVQALVALGYTFGDADQAVRAVLEAGGAETADELLRRALTSR